LVVLGATLVPLFVSPLYFRNLARLPGDRLAFYPLADVVASVSIASELTHTVPPQNPYLPGRPLSYHYGMHLTAALFACFGLPVADLAVRYLPASFMTLTVLACYCLARRWLGSGALAALVALLVVLGEDFSFVPGLLLGSTEPWAVYFFGIPATVSLYLLNPMLPALGFVLVVLICHKRYLDSGRAAWLVLAALASATLVSYKVFAAAQLLAALGVAAVLYAVVFRSRAALASAAAVGLATVPPLLASAAADSSVTISIEAWPYVPAALVRMGLADTRPAQLAMGFFSGEASLLGAAAYYALALPGYLVLTLGARVVGAAAWARSLFRASSADAPRFAMAVLVLAGPLLSLLLAFTAAGYPARQYVNNSVWFFVLSKQLMWFFAVEPLRRLSRPATLAAATGLVALGVPSTAQFLWLQSKDRVRPLERPLVEMLDFLEREARPGATCLAREEIAHAILVTTRCRALAIDVFSYAALPPQRQAELRNARDVFWRHWREGEVQADTLEALGVDYVVVDASRDGLPAAQPERRAPDGPKLEWRFRNHGFAVLRVGRQGPSAAGRGILWPQ
jgi:hypothetical protein